MTAQSSLRRYARIIQRFTSTRATEVLLLQASPFLGALLGSLGDDSIAVGRITLLLAGSFGLTAHVFLFNDWAGQSSDMNDPRRATHAVGPRGISSREVGTLVVALLVVPMFLLALVGAPAVLFGAAIAALSLLYSGSTSWGKGRPILASLLHLIGGTFHFLLGYTVSNSVDARGIAIACFFGLVFAGGHLNHEVRDYDADLDNGIRTNAVAFGRRRTFLCSLFLFTAAYVLLGFLVSLGFLPRPLIWATIFWPVHVAGSIHALRRGLGFDAAVWMQRRYRLQFALLGIGMLLTTPPIAHFAHQRAHHGPIPTVLGARSDVSK